MGSTGVAPVHQPTEHMLRWKIILVKAAGLGAGFALMLSAIAALSIWYWNRPKPPKPWNKNAITAEYDSVRPDGKDDHLKFWYTLQNNTNEDYRLQNKAGVSITGALIKTHSFSQFSDDYEWTDFPIFVPAHSRVRIGIEIPYTYNLSEKENANHEERRAYSAQVAKYVTDKLSNLGGFVLFDDSHRYEIDFPSGWEKPTADPVSAQRPLQTSQ
jgi:hypothetical protein